MVPSPSARPGAVPPAFDAGPFDPVEAFRWGFAVLRAEPQRVGAPLVVGAFAIVLGATLVPSVIGGVLGLLVGHENHSLLSLLVRSLGRLVSAGIGLVTCAYVSAGVYPFVLNVARGRPVKASDLLENRGAMARVLPLLVVSSILVTIGSAFCLLPGVYAVVVTSMAVPLLLDRGLSPLDALRGSFELTSSHWLPVGTLCLLAFLALVAGTLLCFAGAVFVSIPVVLLAQAYAYLKLRGETPVFA